MDQSPMAGSGLKSYGLSTAASCKTKAEAPDRGATLATTE